MSSGSTSRIAPAPADVARIELDVWPLHDAAPLSWLVPVAVLATGLIVQAATGRFLFGLLTDAALLVALWRFFVPVQLVVDSRGVTQHALGRSRLLPWRTISAWHIRPTGILLFRQPQPSLLDAGKGVFLPWCGQREEIVRLVESFVGKEREVGEGGGR